MKDLPTRLREQWEPGGDIYAAAAEIERLRAALLNILAKAESGFTFNHANLATQCRRALGVDQQTADKT